MRPQEAKKIQAEIFKKMPAGKKIKIASQLILLAKKLKEAKEVSKKK